jgi:small subunit ribosomal protein S6
LTQIYETLVLLDNDVVRTDWKKAKAIVSDTITKYDGTIHSCRRWDEKRLAYPINRKNRATYYLAYFEMPGDKIPGFRRDFELNERVLRSLIVCVDEVSEDEKKLAAEEDGTEYTVPEPPEDDALEIPDEDADEDDSDDIDVDVPAEAGAMD